HSPPTVGKSESKLRRIRVVQSAVSAKGFSLPASGMNTAPRADSTSRGVAAGRSAQRGTSEATTGGGGLQAPPTRIKCFVKAQVPPTRIVGVLLTCCAGVTMQIAIGT